MNKEKQVETIEDLKIVRNELKVLSESLEEYKKVFVDRVIYRLELIIDKEQGEE